MSMIIYLSTFDGHLLVWDNWLDFSNIMTCFIYLFFSGLSKRTTDETLRETFSAFGEVVHGLFFVLKFFKSFTSVDY